MKYFRFILAWFLLSALLLPVSCGNSGQNNDGTPRAAIIDQLYLRQPNPAYISEATGLLESIGFKVDIWQGNDITVDFYRKLPSLGYRFILFRVHSGTLLELKGDQTIELPYTYIFTAENYTTKKYVTDQLSDKVAYAIMDENSPEIFAVNSKFIRSAKGKFDRTIILAMGCESYGKDDLQQAFMEKGASVYIGWSEVVTLEYDDRVTLDLLRDLCTGGMTIAQGINSTMNELGHDPYFDTFLKFYPQETGARTLKELMK